MSAWDLILNEKLARWKDSGLERQLRESQGRGTRLTMDGREVVSFASNDYLGLSSHPEVIQAAQEALASSGAGATASRLICGTRSEHVRLEKELARFKRTEAALVFSSGYHTALATLGALFEGTSGGAIILDRLAHACLVDGARLSGARVRTFKHNDVQDLRRVLAEESGRSAPAPLMVVVESLYSMDGDLAPLKDIHEAAREVEAWLLVDEAHATGVLGPMGRGCLACSFPDELPRDILSMGTLSKALGSLGGFLCAPEQVIRTIIHAGRSFLFTTGLNPSAAAAGLRSLEIIQKGEHLRERVLVLSARVRAELTNRGYLVLGDQGPILPILIGSEAQASAASEGLLKAGFWAPAIRYPTVKRGQARLRISISAIHSDREVEDLLQAIGDRQA